MVQQRLPFCRRGQLGRNGHPCPSFTELTKRAPPPNRPYLNPASSPSQIRPVYFPYSLGIEPPDYGDSRSPLTDRRSRDAPPPEIGNLRGAWMKIGKKPSGSRSSGFLCFGSEISDDESEEVKRPQGGDDGGGGGSGVSSEDRHRRHQYKLRFRRVLTKIFRPPSQNRIRKESKRPPSLPQPMSLYKQYEKSVENFSRQSTEVDDRKSWTTISTSTSSDLSSLTSSSSTSSTSSSSLGMALAAREATAIAEHVPPRSPKAQRKVQPPTSAAKPMIPPPPPPARKFSPVTRIALLLVTALVMLLVCGRVGAIVSMSLLLFYISRRNYRPTAYKRSESPRVAEETPAARRTRSEVGEDRKKKVVMEGFLRRNRRSLN